MRYCLMLDLHSDSALIAEYEQLHLAIWPEVATHLRSHGVTDMAIYRLGTRLCMIMDTDDAVFNFERMSRAVAADPRLAEWEQTMWRFQVPTPWTPLGEKWVAASQIFDLKTQP
jgi:L-rhamnose mutarotase